MTSLSPIGEWSAWYNSDRPWIGSGDVETLKAIEVQYGPVCGYGHSVQGAECQLTKTGYTFSQMTSYELRDHLNIACTSKGLLCLNGDQSHRALRRCQDYAVRFYCTKNNNSNEAVDRDNASSGFFPQFDVRIYIILAVVPILIFLIRLLWAFVFRRRRRLRRRRARQQRSGNPESDDDNTSIGSSVANGPPSYHQLFGDLGSNRSNPGSVFAITKTNITVCRTCREGQCSVARAVAPKFGTQLVQNGPGTVVALLNSPSGVMAVSSELDGRRVANAAADPSTGRDPVVSATSMERLQTQSQASNIVGGGGGGGASGNCPMIVGGTPVVQNDSEVESGMSDADVGNVYGSSVKSTQTNASSSFNSTESQNITVYQSGSPHNNTPAQASPHGASHIAMPLEEIVLNTTTLQHTHEICNGISQPCPCACHRTMSIPANRGRSISTSGYDNGGFHNEAETAHFPGMHHAPIPSLQRVWSNLSTGSSATLSELPTYEDALELIKTKEEKAMADAI